ncbi:MAG: RdgB/HAM1 family non-canonical purine NTP pyrophosphatase [Chthoniobacterales bacterium]
MHSLLLATRNAHKTREFAAILGPGFEVTDLAAFPDQPPVDETGSTFEENATLKALASSRLLPGRLIVADDSGLEVDALGGAPGVHSARYAGENATDANNVAKLLAELARRPGFQPGSGLQSRSPSPARFVCVLALAEQGETIGIFRGAVEGNISEEPRGHDGFGYDPIFQPAGHHRTFAELGQAKKNAISHRARAIAQLREHFEKHA